MNLVDVKPMDLSPAPAGWYPFKIVVSEAATAKKSGAPMLKWTGEIRGESEHAGKQFFDNAITDKEFKGAGFGVKKLMGLGVDLSQARDDEAVATDILGLEAYVQLGLEQRMDETVAGSGVYDKKVFEVDPVTGKEVPAMRNKPLAYSTQPLGGRAAGPSAPQSFAAPPMQPQAPAGFAPPPGFAPAPGFAPPAAPAASATAAGYPTGYYPQPTAPVGYPQPTAPVGYPQPTAPVAAAPVAAPGGFAVPPGFAPPPPNGAGGVQPPHIAEAAKKGARARK